MTKASLLPVSARTGDILLVRASTLIRVMTGETASHVALLFSTRSGLYVLEAWPKVGLRIRNFSTWWLEYGSKHSCWHGVSPLDTPGARVLAAKRAFSYFGKEYGYGTLLLVWLAQVFRFRFLPSSVWGRLTRSAPVCSTLVWDAWRAGGWSGPEYPPSPGDFFRWVEAAIPLEDDNACKTGKITKG